MPLTNQINTLIEARTQTRYDDLCFSQELALDGVKKVLVNDTFTIVNLLTLREKMIPKTMLKLEFNTNWLDSDTRLVFYKIVVIMLQD
jgi:hypothetical protein